MVRFLLSRRGVCFQLHLPSERAAGLFQFFVNFDGSENRDAMWDSHWPVSGKLDEFPVCNFFFQILRSHNIYLVNPATVTNMQAY